MAIDLRDAIDNAPIGRLQWSVAVLLTLVLLLEGIDFQSTAYAAPVLMKVWGLGKLQFAPLIAAASIGMAVGTLIGSWTGDRFGRRPTLIVSVAFFGAMTIACAFASGPRVFMLLRFVSGLGFGAAFPAATATMGEWMPRRIAGKAISIMTIGIPGGIVIGALIASWYLPGHGWRAFFVGVGIASLAFAVVLAAALPESPSFEAWRGRHAQVHALLRRSWGSPVGDGTSPFHLERTTQGTAKLFAPKHARTNAGLWLAYLASSLGTYTMGAWLTVVLTGFGLPLAAALRGPVVYSSTAIVGAVAAGWLIGRFGSRRAMLALAALGAASALGIALAIGVLPAGSTLFAILYAGIGLLGFTIGAVIPASLVVATNAYETEIRARGIGTMAAVGRVGQILSGFAGGAVLATAPAGAFFALIAGLIALVIVGALIVDQHLVRTAAA